MTYDKIKHYLGEGLTNFIASLDRHNLEKMKRELIADINLHKKGTEILFKRTVELELINNLLK